MSEVHEWWQRGVIYQIYPRSFQDSNGDGVGDLKGIISRLDYLQWLGVDAIWLSPVFPSPMADFGYDVSNYTSIDPLFGTVEDFDVLLQQAHDREIRVILDFVPNHTSDQHAWFRESRSSRSSAKRDWYIWRDAGPNGEAPTNWLSSFGGPAWTWDATTEQYYHHHFLPQQPDLNWRNPEVVDAMLHAMQFWLDRGVDGFRMDVIWLIIKDDQFRDNPENPDFQPHEPPHHRLLATYTTDRPEVHDIISRMRLLLDRYHERMMVGEIYLPIERLMTYYGARGDGVHLPFNFQLINMPWNPKQIAEAIGKYEASLPAYGWPNWVLGNHDQPRLATRIGYHQTRLAAMLLLTLRGTPTLYYGDELGMLNVPIPPELVQDPVEKNLPGMGMGRDPQRTPMPWSSQNQAGFTEAVPWLPLGDYEARNVEQQQQDPRSLLELYRRLLALRRREAALAIGGYTAYRSDEQVLAYVRRKGEAHFLVVLNFSNHDLDFDAEFMLCGRIALSTMMDRDDEEVGSRIRVRAYEGLVIDCAEGLC